MRFLLGAMSLENLAQISTRVRHAPAACSPNTHPIAPTPGPTLKVDRKVFMEYMLIRMGYVDDGVPSAPFLPPLWKFRAAEQRQNTLFPAVSLAPLGRRLSSLTPLSTSSTSTATRYSVEPVHLPLT